MANPSIQLPPATEPGANQETGRADLPPPVLAYCTEHRLLPAVQTTLDLVRACFASERITLTTDDDPEFDQRWVVIDVAVEGEVEAVLGAYERFTRAWLAAVPTAERRHLRVLYNFT
jgi:hypothetical protein